MPNLEDKGCPCHIHSLDGTKSLTLTPGMRATENTDACLLSSHYCNVRDSSFLHSHGRCERVMSLRTSSNQGRSSDIRTHPATPYLSKLSGGDSRKRRMGSAQTDPSRPRVRTSPQSPQSHCLVQVSAELVEEDDASTVLVDLLELCLGHPVPTKAAHAVRGASYSGLPSRL